MIKTRAAFDTLGYANRLKIAGVSPVVAEAQAEANAEMINGLLEDTLVTKQDLLQVETNLGYQIKELRLELRSECQSIRSELKQDMKDLETQLTIRLGGIVLGGMGLLTAVMSLLRVTH